MTRAQAEAEARRRWGSIGRVEKRGSLCVVGLLKPPMIRGGKPGVGCKGSGKTWTAAFKDADRFEKENAPALKLMRESLAEINRFQEGGDDGRNV